MNRLQGQDFIIYLFLSDLAHTSVLNFIPTQKSAFHRAQTLSYKNGYALPIRPTVGIGRQPLSSENLLQDHMNQLSIQTAVISDETFTRTRPSDFVPAHVAYDKKVKNTPFQRSWKYITILTG